jgi:shikimate kinase
MGAGKSSIGRATAQLLGLPFVDTDALIEQHHGAIPAIFAQHGEQVFRELERDEVVAALTRAQMQPCVVALGGGAVLSAAVRDALAQLAHVVWLSAPQEVLWERVQQEGAAGRPLAADEQRFARLLAERSALYAAVATAQVVTCNRSAADIAAEVALIAQGPPRATASREARSA